MPSMWILKSVRRFKISNCTTQGDRRCDRWWRQEGRCVFRDQRRCVL